MAMSALKIWVAEAMRGVDNDPPFDGIYAVGTGHRPVRSHQTRTGHCPVPTLNPSISPGIQLLIGKPKAKRRHCAQFY